MKLISNINLTSLSREQDDNQEIYHHKNFNSGDNMNYKYMFWMPKFVKHVFVRPDVIFEQYKKIYIEYKKRVQEMTVDYCTDENNDDCENVDDNDENAKSEADDEERSNENNNLEDTRDDDNYDYEESIYEESNHDSNSGHTGDVTEDERDKIDVITSAIMQHMLRAAVSRFIFMEQSGFFKNRNIKNIIQLKSSMVYCRKKNVHLIIGITFNFIYMKSL